MWFVCCGSRTSVVSDGMGGDLIRYSRIALPHDIIGSEKLQMQFLVQDRIIVKQPGCNHLLFYLLLVLQCNKENTTIERLRDAFQNKCWEGDIGPYGREGGKKIPFFGSSKRGHILMGEGSKSFCLMSHVHFCASVSTQFVAFLEALHYGNFLYLLIK